jgi:bifunctional non-homologous end joining protein LigD
VIKAAARALAEYFVTHQPDRFVATMTKAKRGGKIFIDHFRNERGATAVCPFSPRARAGAPVAWPLRWSDLQRVERADAVTLSNARKHDADAWLDYGAVSQTLSEAALVALGVNPR